MTQGDVATAVDWDDASRPTGKTVTLPGLATPVRLSQSWSATGQLTSLGDPGGTTTYTYPSRRLLGTVADTAAGTFRYTYDSSGRTSAMERPNGTADGFTWQGTDLVDQVTRRGATVINRYTYARDSAGRITGFTDADGAHAYSYDGDGRLTSANHPGASGLAQEQYTYDGNGNRLSWPGHPAAAVKYDAVNRLLADGTKTYTYDDEGRLTAAENTTTGVVTTYEWNALDQLVAIRRPGTQTTYTYDAYGDRVVTRTDGATTYTVYDEQHGRRLVLAPNGTIRSRFVTAGAVGTELAVLDGGQWRYPLLDFQNTARAVTATDGTVARRVRYGTFGTSSATPEAADQWHGMPAGPDDLQLSWARPYDTTTGRFISEDPVAAANLYSYSLNNPCQLSDTLGLAAIVEKKLADCLKLFKKGVHELHHVISKWALKQMGMATTGTTVWFALLPKDVHSLTNTYGNWTNNFLMRLTELSFLQAGKFQEILDGQIDILQELTLAVSVAPLIICHG
jgi:RHS repeat-associated protein